MTKKNSEKKAVKGFYLSQGQTQKIRYVEAKSDHYKLSYEPAKLGRLLAHTYCLYYEYVTRFEKEGPVDNT